MTAGMPIWNRSISRETGKPLPHPLTDVKGLFFLNFIFRHGNDHA